MLPWILAAFCLAVIGTTTAKSGAPGLGITAAAAALLAAVWFLS